MRRVTSVAALFILLLLAMSVHAGQNFIAIAYHDVGNNVSAENNPDRFIVSTQNLAAHFAWLQHHGYTPVSIDDLMAASRNEQSLPDKAVLLTFDDGFKSLYTDVYPLLKIFNYPAVASVVTDWLDAAPGQTIYYGGKQLARDAFISWDEARQMQASGLVEIASHSANLHRGIVANPQANLMPSAASRAYGDGRYESYGDFHARIASDLARSVDAIGAELGSFPRVMTWPYGKYTMSNLDLAARLGMPISLTLEVGKNSLADFSRIRRVLIRGNPGIGDFSAELLLTGKSAIVRVAHVDLDYVYDEDPVRQKSKLDALLERIKELQISHVFLQAFADLDGDAAADALYFPNRHLPVRADLFSRVAWQLKTRAEVRVFARMPMLAFRGQNFDSAWEVDEDSAALHPEVRRVIREIYQDLATYADFDGILFHDDTRLNKNWSRSRTQALIDFGGELVWVLQENRPELKTARNLFAPAVLDDLSETWLAQSLRLFLGRYDYVALTAMPQLENSDSSDRYLDRLATAGAQHDGGLEGTIFELQTIDWRTGTVVPATTLYEKMRRLQAAGVKHLAYYSDDFIANSSAQEQIRQGISLADYPFRDQ